MAILLGLKIAYIVIMVLTTVMLGSVLYTIWAMPDLPTQVITDELCLPKWLGAESLHCDKVEISVSGFINKRLNSLHKTHITDENNRVQAEQNELSVSLKSFLETLYPYRRPSGRFVGKDVGVTTDDSTSMTPITNWQSGRRNTDYGGFSRYGIQLQDGRITVPLTGLYFIYSLIDMYEPCDRATGMPNIKVLNGTVRHCIQRYNVKTGVDEEIVSSSIPHQKSKRFKYNYYSSYVSTVHALTAGDELSLKMSNATYLNFSPEKNYFGVNMI